ncbi:hypothetical protein [Rhizobium sp. BK176]|uniref:hypothetical protein n=1 Tax=Rhizobium sp. BK176 TaxID=2587071 RepID=UPI00216898AF|nr:hypothetical protein [Rhizobium sp. BK176]MCS4090146.1 hypothetical protein [Rhizobium sp. BK176]
MKSGNRFTMVDGRGERHEVHLQRFMGGYAVRVDDDLLYDGEVYETRERAFGAIRLAWGNDIRLEPI